MEIERRLDSIEQEVQLLKAQIQATLLDIQEQLLTSKYPTLRMEEPAQSQPARMAAPPAPETVPEMTDVPQRQAPPARHADMEPMQPVFVKATAAPARQEPLELPSRPLVTNEDWLALAKIAQWMNGKAAELGPQRMRALVKMYAQKQHLEPEVMESLLQFLNLYGEEAGMNMADMSWMANAAKASSHGQAGLDFLDSARVSADGEIKTHRSVVNAKGMPH